MKHSNHSPALDGLVFAIVNIKNNDNYCFIWSYIGDINPQNKNSNRIKLSDKELFKEIHEKLKDFKLPLEINKN